MEYAVLEEGLDLSTFPGVLESHSSHVGSLKGAFFSENAFLSLNLIRVQSGLRSLGIFRVSQHERSLEARLLVQIVNQAGKCGISPASSCHLEMSSRKEQPLYHRGYKRNR